VRTEAGWKIAHTQVKMQKIGVSPPPPLLSAAS